MENTERGTGKSGRAHQYLIAGQLFGEPCQGVCRLNLHTFEGGKDQRTSWQNYELHNTIIIPHHSCCAYVKLQPFVLIFSTFAYLSLWQE